MLNLVICVIYRQPDDSTHGFPSRNPELKAALNKIQEAVMKLGDPLPDIIFGGDFNLPHVRWPDCARSAKCVKTEREMIQSLNNFLCCFCLHQIVTKPTHIGGNLLDCIFVNNELLVHAVNVNEVLPSISHHKVVEVSTNLYVKSSGENENSSSKLKNRFNSLNFFHSDISWENIIASLQQTDWAAEFQNKSVDTMLDIFYEKCYTICVQCVPKRKSSTSSLSKLEKYRRKLCRRRKRINKTLINVRSSRRKNKLSSELIDIEKKLTKSYKEEREYQEHIALGSIKKNVKYFYKYVCRFSKVKQKIGPLTDEAGNVINDSHTMANMFLNQFEKMFSKPKTDLSDVAQTTNPFVCSNKVLPKKSYANIKFCRNKVCRKNILL